MRDVSPASFGAPSARLARRALLGTVLLAPLAAAATGPEVPTLLVPGPENGAAARWATRALRLIGRATPHNVLPRLTIVGGPDGVTAANRFNTAEAGEGRYLLVLTGNAVLAFLSGTERAHYQPGNWLPLCASWTGVLVAGRGSLAAAARSRAPIRLSASVPNAPGTAAMLAAESPGVATLPAPVSPVATENAFREGALDALVFAGPDAARRAAAMGATPWFGFGSHGSEAPDYAALARGVPTPLRQAVSASVGASQLRGALLLPGLTSADVVASWRQAALRWRDGELAEAPEAEGEPLVGVDAANALSTLLPPPDAVLAWRDWLQRRLNVRPN